MASQFEGLEVGEFLEYPAAQVGNVRSQASLNGFRFGRTFVTHIDREKNCIIVTRTK